MFSSHTYLSTCPNLLPSPSSPHPNTHAHTFSWYSSSLYPRMDAFTPLPHTHTHTDWHGHPKTRVHHSLSLGLSHQRLHCSRFLCHICHATAVSLWTQHPSCICPIWSCFNTTSELAGRQWAGERGSSFRRGEVGGWEGEERKGREGEELYYIITCGI